jgi:hypothetical protein
MRIQKILLYIEPKALVEPISLFAMNLARPYDARVFALSIIKHQIPEIKARSEEQAWKRLYEIEEDAFEAGIKTSLLLEEIETVTQNRLTTKLINLCQTFKTDLLVVSSDAKLNIKKLIGETTIPIIIVPPIQNLSKLEV